MLVSCSYENIVDEKAYFELYLLFHVLVNKNKIILLRHVNSLEEISLELIAVGYS